MIRAVLFDYGSVLNGPILPHFKVRRLARDLRANGIKTGILSNIFLLAAWVFKLSGGYRNFDPVILSFKEKIRKPEAGVYEIAIKKMGVRPEEIIFVDNLEVNVDAAERLGMKVVLARSSGQVVKDVKEMLSRENGLNI